VKLTRGAPAIRTENALLAAYVFVDIREARPRRLRRRAQQAVPRKVKFPPGLLRHLERASSSTWSAPSREAEDRGAGDAALIFLLLYLNFRPLTETLIVMLSVPFALVGGVWLMWWLGYKMSVAVAVGFIALAGVAAETGVVMLIYLDHAGEAVQARSAGRGRRSRRRRPLRGDHGRRGRARAAEDDDRGGDHGRPAADHVEQGTGSEVMSRIAAPMVGGMVSSTVLTLVVIPAIYAPSRSAKAPCCASARPASAPGATIRRRTSTTW
jgi:Cu(I)/Ag(I) efflux system membrane protein CusA/SilA